MIKKGILPPEGKRERTVGEKLRLDQWLAANHPEHSRSRWRELIRDGYVLVNGKVEKPSYEYSDKDAIEFIPYERHSSDLKPYDLPLKIFFEDEQLIVIHKPRGLTVHKGAGTDEKTLVGALIKHFQNAGDSWQAPGPSDRPGIVHRLDKDTTGVMVCAKTEFALRYLSKQFAEKTSLRIYEALSAKMPPQWRPGTELSFESYLGRDPRNRLAIKSFEEDGPGRRFARSHFRVKNTFFDTIAHLEVRLDTGRTHQVRVHAKTLGAPLLGDPLYGEKRTWPDRAKALAKKLDMISVPLLHAKYLEFTHPLSQDRLAFISELPSDMKEVLALLEV